jgi:hypothetical protein
VVVKEIDPFWLLSATGLGSLNWLLVGTGLEMFRLVLFGKNELVLVMEKWFDLAMI